MKRPFWARHGVRHWSCTNLSISPHDSGGHLLSAQGWRHSLCSGNRSNKGDRPKRQHAQGPLSLYQVTAGKPTLGTKAFKAPSFPGPSPESLTILHKAPCFFLLPSEGDGPPSSAQIPCYRLNVSSSQFTYWNPTPNLMVWGGGAFWK